jgi:hypothetical protein
MYFYEEKKEKKRKAQLLEELEKLPEPIKLTPTQIKEKLDILSQCGIKIAHPFSIKNILESKDYKESDVFELEDILFWLEDGGDYFSKNIRCKNLLYIDSECVDAPEIYEELTKRIAEISQGSLNFKNIKTSVDLNKYGYWERVWLSFEFENKKIELACKVDNDWLDENIFLKFTELLETANPEKIFAEYDLGQVNIITCIKKDELKKLNSFGIGFEPLCPNQA